MYVGVMIYENCMSVDIGENRGVDIDMVLVYRTNIGYCLLVTGWVSYAGEGVWLGI